MLADEERNQDKLQEPYLIGNTPEVFTFTDKFATAI